ncbi:MAG: single-stranded-DNA-specific exonuclease RecJ [Patescibacteria group bacterium]
MGNAGQQGQVKWELRPRTNADVVTQLLENRGIVDREVFFNPDYERDSHDPMLLPNIQVALERIQRAIETKELVYVYGDYDADGIPGTAVLVKTLQANGANVRSYIPDREREGYGLNKIALAYLKEQGAQLVITVDLGITARDEVSLARGLGIDVIITDHHHVDPDRVPIDAIAVVHPGLPDSTYPFDGLAGGGVAWKVSQALANLTGKPNMAQLKWWLELPAICTVCDMMPLTGENRMIVHYGLKVLMQTRNIGLQAMYRAAGIAAEDVTERTIGYQIGPRINAPGRIDHASSALELLLTDDVQLAQELAAKTELQNQNRQEQLDTVVKEAIARVDAEQLADASAIVIAQEGWGGGVVGLAASRLVERYHRPVIVLTIKDGIAKGSGRSIDGFDLLAGIDSCQDILITYGGHVMAAGLQLKVEQLETFRDRFIAYAKQNLTPEQLVRRKTADLLIEPAQITDELVTTLLRFAPFGKGNAKPKFIVGPLTVADCRPVGAAKQHVKLRFTSGLEAIGFNCSHLVEHCPVGAVVGVFGTLEFNSWNGHQVVQLMMDDLKPVAELKQEGILVPTTETKQGEEHGI